MESIFFELNNWFSGRDYPYEEPFTTWISERQLTKEDWVEENGLVVVCGPLDMSLNYCVTAPKDWVENNCPNLLSDDGYDYEVLVYSKGENKIVTEHRDYKDFLRFSEEGDEVPEGRWGMPFLPYAKSNVGVHWVDIENDYDVEDDEDD